MSSADDFKAYLEGFKAGSKGRDSFTTEQIDQLTARVDTLIAELKDDNGRLVAANADLTGHLESARAANETLTEQLNQPPAPTPPAPIEPVIVQPLATQGVALSPNAVPQPVVVNPVEAEEPAPAA